MKRARIWESCVTPKPAQQNPCKSCAVVLCLFSRRRPRGELRADRRSCEPRRFGRGERRERLKAKRSRPEMAPQRLEKIESAPGNGMGSEPSNLQDLVHGRAADRARLRLTSRRNHKVAELQKKAPTALKSLDAELKSAPAFRIRTLRRTSGLPKRLKRWPPPRRYFAAACSGGRSPRPLSAPGAQFKSERIA